MCVISFSADSIIVGVLHNEDVNEDVTSRSDVESYQDELSFQLDQVFSSRI